MINGLVGTIAKEHCKINVFLMVRKKNISGSVTFLGHARKVTKVNGGAGKASVFFAHPLRGLNEILDPSKATYA